MTERAYPRFVDFEASSLSTDSYPIEIAWSDAHGRIQSYLINPSSVPWWTDWSDESQAVHGIARADLLRDGRDPIALCEHLESEVHGQTLFSDAPEFDEAWLRELFRGARRALPDVRIASMAELAAFGGPDNASVAQLRREARRRAGGAHRAGVDVMYLLELFRLAQGGSP